MTKNEFPCRVDGCDGVAACKGFCKKHYSAARRNGDPSLKTQPPCGQEACTYLAYAKGLCDKHYALARRHKELEATPCSVYRCEGAVFGHGLCVNHYQRKRRLEKRQALLDVTLDEDGHLKKECIKCGVVKSHSEFYRRRSVVGTGRSSWCRVCIKANKIVKAYGTSWERAVDLASGRTCSSCQDHVPLVRTTSPTPSRPPLTTAIRPDRSVTCFAPTATPL